MKSIITYFNYFSFLEAILPKARRKFSKKFVKKIQMTEEIEKPEYDSVCSLMRMLEKEVEMKRLIQKKI